MRWEWRRDYWPEYGELKKDYWWVESRTPRTISSSAYETYEVRLGRPPRRRLRKLKVKAFLVASFFRSSNEEDDFSFLRLSHQSPQHKVIHSKLIKSRTHDIVLNELLQWQTLTWSLYQNIRSFFTFVFPISLNQENS